MANNGTRTLNVNVDKCTGCGTCKLACSMMKGEGNGMARPRIHIEPNGEDSYIQLTCFQCVSAACATVCPVEALVRNEQTRAIEVDRNRCIRCGLCESACPFGHMHFNRETRLPEKCDLCNGAPACAKFCPHGALEY